MLLCATQMFADFSASLVGAFRMMHALLLVGKFQNTHEPVTVNTCSVQVQPQVEAVTPRSASHIRSTANVPIPYPSLISKLAASRRLKPHAESTESAEFFLEHESPEFHKFCFLTQPPLSFFVMKNTQKLCIRNFFAIFATKFFITMSYGN